MIISKFTNVVIVLKYRLKAVAIVYCNGRKQGDKTLSPFYGVAAGARKRSPKSTVAKANT